MKNEAPISLKYHFVAFIDILGFSDMVQHDCSGPLKDTLFLRKLLSLHDKVRCSNATNRVSVTQFSDSIVLTLPYSPNYFGDFVKTVAEFQHSLFINGVLCRGGLSYGKHFERESFLFSEALIKAYKIENGQATYPRVVVDEDLIDLLEPQKKLPLDLILKEADGATFLHYLNFGNKDVNRKAVASLTNYWEKKTVRVREKLRWIRDYFSYCYPDTRDFVVARFQKVSCPNK